MYQVDKIKANLGEIKSLELLADVFTDVAQARLERVRQGVESNRIYVGEIARVLHVVRVTAEKNGLSAKRKKQASASLLLTSNKRLYYGDLDVKVVDFYIAHTSYLGFADRFVIGSVGADVLAGKKYPFEYESIVFKEEMPSTVELSVLAKKLVDYQKVLVYYPRFMTVLSQLPSLVDITGLTASATGEQGVDYYLFEPEIGKILNFFEEQIMQLLLEQAFMEAELARIGTQLTTMDNARQRANKIITRQELMLSIAQKQYLNMQSQEIAGTMLRMGLGKIQ